MHHWLKTLQIWVRLSSFEFLFAEAYLFYFFVNDIPADPSLFI